MTTRTVPGNTPGRVSTARTTEEVERLRPQWPSADLADIDADIDFLLAVLRGMEGTSRPHVVRIERAGRPDLWGIARIESMEQPLRLGYSVLARPSLRALVVCFGGIHGAASAEDEGLVLAELLRELRSGHADLVLLRNLDVAGTLLATVSRAVTWPERSHGLTETDRWVTDTTGTLVDILSAHSGKSRRRILGKDRAFVREFGDRQRVRVFTEPSGAAQLRADMVTVAQRSYQERLGAAYSDSVLERELVTTGLAQGWFRAWVLYVDDRPVAFWSGTVFNGVFTTWSPGFDEEYARHAVGRFTMFRMIEDLCASADVHTLDHGSGDAQYKREFGRSVGRHVDVHVVARRPRPLALNAAMGTLGVINTQGRSVAGNSEIGRRAKQMWRKRGRSG
ncbi:GNAT family N-acetyltransferase [Kribbia dieselivorans]|uniref:GNAT family N-acetyltransferase n=1 Tax=Kribbia dieselivorans TaxID=331526 RepID=UPI0008391DAC|nr:GNAT family N-acetyltransferase [Kribbia dieselivorans]